MPVHNNYRRQDGVPAIPTITGITGASTIDSTVPTGTALQTDSGSSDASVSVSAPALATSVSPVTFTPKASAATSDSTSTATGLSDTEASGPNISTGATIAACVCAVSIVILLILIALLLYRRFIRKLKVDAQAASEKRAARARGKGDRPRNRSMENWNKMEEVGEEGKIRTKETLTPPGIGEMAIFQRSPTLRSPMSENMTEENDTGLSDRPFARYHTMADEKPSEPYSPSQNAVPEHAPSPLWKGEEVGTEALLSHHSASFEKSSGTSLSKAIPTPPAVEHQLHKWESAEVLHCDANPTPDDEHVEFHNDTNPTPVDDVDNVKKENVSIGSNKRTDPFEEAETRKDVNNPFFNAQDYTGRDCSSLPLSAKAQGKQKQVDPFDDDNAPAMVVPLPSAKPAPTVSTASYNGDRALQSLINVLDISEAEIQERLRIASLQPSFVSATSYYSADEADVASTFPHTTS